ncbi:MAG: hypothetical protein K1Y36_10840 [Blastocatellia bacterium]|nr:hypothetical protein [Blastocatellia bacterium]
MQVLFPNGILSGWAEGDSWERLKAPIQSISRLGRSNLGAGGKRGFTGNERDWLELPGLGEIQRDFAN